MQPSKKQSAAEGYDLFLLMVTNILDSNTRLLVIGEPKEMVEKAFENDSSGLIKLILPCVVSRKTDLPQLEAAFATLKVDLIKYSACRSFRTCALLFSGGKINRDLLK